jgi:hypothetical protein
LEENKTEPTVSGSLVQQLNKRIRERDSRDFKDFKDFRDEDLPMPPPEGDNKDLWDGRDDEILRLRSGRQRWERGFTFICFRG